MAVRTARYSDIPEIMTVLEAARGIMRADGNSGQWVNGYPSEEVIRGDIGSGAGHVLEACGRVAGYFAFIPSPEPTYAEIYGGAWLDDVAPYHVIHRIASLPEVHGVFDAVMKFAFSRDKNITSSSMGSAIAGSSFWPPETSGWPIRSWTRVPLKRFFEWTLPVSFDALPRWTGRPCRVHQLAGRARDFCDVKVAEGAVASGVIGECPLFFKKKGQASSLSPFSSNNSFCRMVKSVTSSTLILHLYFCFHFATNEPPKRLVWRVR